MEQLVRQWLEQLEAGQVQAVTASMREEIEAREDYWERKAMAEEAWLHEGAELIRELNSAAEYVEGCPF